MSFLLFSLFFFFFLLFFLFSFRTRILFFYRLLHPTSFCNGSLGDNAILLVANKIDLLPAGASNERILKWINSAVGKRGIASNIIGTHLISCQTGEGKEKVRRKERGKKKEGQEKKIKREIKEINIVVRKRGIASNRIGTHLISCQTGR